MEKTLLIKFGGEETWTASELDNLLDAIDGVVDHGTSVIAVPDDIDFLSPEEAEEFADQLISEIKETE